VTDRPAALYGRDGTVLLSLRGARLVARALELLTRQPAARDARPQRRATSRYFPNWLRQRIEAIIWTLQNQLGPERQPVRAPAGLWARLVQRRLALNAVIWFNWQIGAPVKRSLIASDHLPAQIPGQRSSGLCDGH
jgi:hypothetical protein